jgi:hypothetical protein
MNWVGDTLRVGASARSSAGSGSNRSRPLSAQRALANAQLCDGGPTDQRPLASGRYSTP